MIIDNEAKFHDDRVITTADATEDGDVVDLGPDGSGDSDFTVEVQMTNDATAGTNITASLYENDTPDSVSPVLVVAGPTVVLADLVAGKILLSVRAPFVTERYIFVRIASTGTFSTNTTLSAHIILSRQRGVPQK